MGKRRRKIDLTLDERLRDSERRPTSMSLPLALHHRLDVMAGQADDVSATRAELVGMLLAEASLDPEELEMAILKYRKLKVRDVLPEEETGSLDNVVSFTKRGPGRPARNEVG
jgi:hypothetical protein